MKPLSIRHLALLHLLLTSLILLAMGLYFWQEIRQTRLRFQSYEDQTARQELAEGVQIVMGRMRAMGDSLAQWDETRQQLSFREYYTLWRDERVHNSGLLATKTAAVALYDESGRILPGSNGPRPMPTSVPGKPPTSLLIRDAGHENLYYYTPVYADSAATLLLGYLGLRLDFRNELEQARAYRYADLDSLRIDLPVGKSLDTGRILAHLRIRAQDNPQLQEFQRLLESSTIRLALALLISTLIAAVLLERMLVRPLRHLSGEIDALREKTHSRIAPQGLEALPLPVQELENVWRSFNDYQSRLAELHLDLQRSSQDFFDQARRDALTGAYNRRAFDEHWREAARDRRLDNVALLLFDCDHFKAINDTYGHNVGDAVIQAIARCLQQALRVDDRLYRIGGDEFATVLIDTDVRHSQTVAERCLEHILSHDFRQNGLSEPVTISIGVAIAQDIPETRERISLSELQKRADLAMYTAKRPGGQKIVFYTPALGNVESLVASRPINAVFRAIQDPDLLEMTYQPVVRLHDLQKEYSEALVRIRFEGQLIQPREIFPIIQDRNLDAEFDLAILRAIHRDMDDGTLAPAQGVSINLSAAGVINARVMDALVALLEAERNRKIVVEITETTLITQMELATVNIRRLRQAGALVALDDFGSGYSSLRYLASMPVDLVKFDISMVRLLESDDARQRHMIEEIAHMVLSAGYELVAEGIETEALLDRVMRLGFSHAQGYYFGRPVEDEAAQA
ncbi:MAG TPA: EAL domain-containing protein [Thiobacillaceae bacterium]|nr:EAL domain-containing protein [Thiobacillaceae bacterium]HNU62982.1 EAL domain-containing protein [Thiobacillaceae bacterium]